MPFYVLAMETAKITESQISATELMQFTVAIYLDVQWNDVAQKKSFVIPQVHFSLVTWVVKTLC